MRPGRLQGGFEFGQGLLDAAGFVQQLDMAAPGLDGDRPVPARVAAPGLQQLAIEFASAGVLAVERGRARQLLGNVQGQVRSRPLRQEGIRQGCRSEEHTYELQSIMRTSY